MKQNVKPENKRKEPPKVSYRKERLRRKMTPVKKEEKEATLKRKQG
jgi:hypothetical protein